MKVKQLIKFLEKQDPDLPVVFKYIESSDYGSWDNYQAVCIVYVGKPEDCVSDFLSEYAEITEAVIVY